MQLTEQQQAAAEDRSKRCVTIAGAGAGKTRVLERRVASLMSGGVPPDSILVITFTTAAATEIAERLEASGHHHIPYTATFHAWFARILRRHHEAIGRTDRFWILDETAAEELWEEAGKDIDEYRDAKRTLDALDFDDLERLVHQLVVGDDDHEPNPSVLHDLRVRYSDILVDEYQDVNAQQAEIVDTIGADRTFLVGDPRQAIYRFRGSDPSHMKRAMEDATVIVLPHNFRSTPEIVKVGNLLGEPPLMEAAREDEGVVTYTAADDEHASAGRILQSHHDQEIPWSDMVVLGRTWRELERVGRVLGEAGIPHVIPKKSDDVLRTIPGRVLAYAALLVLRPHLDHLALRVYRAVHPHVGSNGARRLLSKALTERRTLIDVVSEDDPDMGALMACIAAIVGDVDDAEVCDVLEPVAEQLVRSGWPAALVQRCMAAFEGVPMSRFGTWWGTRSRAGEPIDTSEDAVTLLTVHGAKGLEWPIVVGINVRDGVYPSRRKRNTEEDRQEDMRVLYVLATRARDALHLLFPREYYLPFGQGRTELGASVTPIAHLAVREDGSPLYGSGEDAG